MRASDLSAWAYCHRAWWLANVQGVAHAAPEALARGHQAHRRHGAAVARAGRLQRAAVVLFALALLAALAALAGLLLG